MMKPRTYGRMELAQVYFPDMQPRHAFTKLMQWIRYNPQLTAKLKKLNKNDKCRTYTPAQVAAIFEVLGEP